MEVIKKYSIRQRVISPYFLLCLLLSLVLFSQVPLSLIAFEINLPNRTIMLALRALTLIISSLILIHKFQKPMKAWVLTLSIFWTFYMTRLFFDYYFMNISLSIPLWEIAAWGIGASFLPALATYTVTTKCKGILDSIPLIIFGTISLGLSYLIFSLNFNPLVNRFLLADLNPIPAGHAGASLFLISFSSLILDTKTAISTKLRNWICMSGILVGMIITYSSSTRSAFLSLVAGSILIVMAGIKSTSTKKKYLILFSTLGVSVISYWIFGSSGLMQKIQTLGHGESELHRLVLISSSFNHWTSNPLFGKGFAMHELLENVFLELNHYYPHNFIMESLFIGGLSLALILIFLIALTTWMSIQLIIQSKYDLWLVCLWLQAIIYVMVSGHLGNVPLFWCASAAICGRYSGLALDRRDT